MVEEVVVEGYASCQIVKKCSYVKDKTKQGSKIEFGPKISKIESGKVERLDRLEV